MSIIETGCEVIVATTGKLLDLCRQHIVFGRQLKTLIHFDHLEIFALDEADQMLEYEFWDDVNE